jgi:chromosome segregation ATPase
MTTAPYDESVHEAVARETARRKRVLLAFLGLLLVPIAIGVYALSKAPTEIERVASDVTPIVTSRVAGNIAERVTSDVSAKTEPLIRQNVAREVKAAVEPRFSSVSNDITQLQSSVQKTSELVESVRPHLALVGQNETTLKNLDVNQARLGREVAANLQTANSNRESMAAISRQLAVMNRELQALQARVQTLENPKPKPMPVPR